MKSRILYIDDDANMRNALELRLNFAKYSLDLGSTVDQAVSFAQNNNYCLILLDYHLGQDNLTGAHAARRIREFDQSTQIVIYTSMPKGKIPGWAFAGETVYLKKPDRNLFKRIDRWCE